MDLDLNPADWAILGVLAEGPAHGFALSQILGSDGPIGRVWAVPRPVVYQVIKKLLALKLISGRKTEPGHRGPVRTVYGVTALGRRAVKAWLAEPVEHVREVRSLLMLKLALLDRAGVDPAELAAAQSAKAEEQLASLLRSCEEATGFDRVILEWRVAGTRAALDFLASVVEL